MFAVMTVGVCTTFPNDAWELYASACLESFVRFWPLDVKLTVYLDDETLALECKRALSARGANCEVRVGKLAAHDRFLRRNSWGEPSDFRFAACRFSHKVAALKATSDRLATDAGSHLIWLDADVITTAPVTQDWLVQFLPMGQAHISYLGRTGFPFSECGFVAYRMSEEASAFLDEFWVMYETEALFKLAQWHDSFVFDRVRERFDPAWFKNIAEGASGVHVWLNTALAERLEHWKGPKAKRLRRPVTDAEAAAFARAARALAES